MKRVTGLGGVFFKSNDGSALGRWYKEHLGIDTKEWGGTAFTWREEKNIFEVGYTVWSPFKDDTEYFAPSNKPWMINYRVHNLVELLEVLRRENVQIVGEMVEEANGKFAWILDPEGTKIELWEPVPSRLDPYLKV